MKLDPEIIKEAKQRSITVSSIQFTKGLAYKNSGIVIQLNIILTSNHCCSGGRITVIKNNIEYPSRETGIVFLSPGVISLSLRQPIDFSAPLPKIKIAEKVEIGEEIFWISFFSAQLKMPFLWVLLAQLLNPRPMV